MSAHKVHLECGDGAASKFWEAEVVGKKLVTRWGWIGSDGQSKTKTCRDHIFAAFEFRKRVDAKLREGYREPAKPIPPRLATRDAALEAAIRADRADPAAYLVYADWLQSHGNPLGELIVLHHARKLKKANALAATLDVPDPELATVGWRFGMWEWLHLENGRDWMDATFDPLALAQRVFSSPMCAALEELRIGILRWDHNDEDVPAVLTDAANHAWAADLSKLHLGAVDGNIDMAHHVIGTVGKLITKTFPKLRSLELHSGDQSWRRKGTFEIAGLALPELTELVIETCSWSKKRMKDLLAASLPKVERLELWFGSADYGANCSVRDLAPLLDSAVFPTLRHLGLRNAEFANALAEALPAAAIAPRLESLDLSMGTMTDDGAAALAAGAKRFKQLKVLSVDENFLSTRVVRELRAVFPSVMSKTQKDADDSIEGELHYYVSVSE
jgi:uncharacterized protein (TIGR02996 family)